MTYSRAQGTRGLVRRLLPLLLSWTVVTAVAVLAPAAAQATPTPMTALINGDSVTTNDGITDSSGPISLEQFAAQHLGYKVTVVSGAQWDGMTAAQFAQYSLLIVGDPMCSYTPASAIANESTWTPVVMGIAGGNTQPGNRALIGTDPEFHYAYGGGGAAPTNPADPTTSGAEHLVESGIHFAGDGPAGTTGVYFDTGCGEEITPGGDLPTLDNLTTTGPGHWTEDTNPPCGGSAQQIAKVSEFANLQDSDIQGWECSVHTTFPTFPADWNAEAVATDTASHPTCGTDPSTGGTACGESYVLLAGTGIVATAPNLSLAPTTGSDPVGGNHTVTATVTEGGSPASGVGVTFAIASGPNAGTTGTCTFSDNSPDPSCQTGADGTVNFTYADTGGAGTDSIDASVTIGGSTEHATATETWVAPSDPAISASGTTITATQQQPFNGTVATFKDPDAGASASEYTATIDWGDGSTPSTGTITGSGGSFTVSGSHTYSTQGSYTATVTITDNDNSANSATVKDPVTVADAPISANGTSVNATEGQGFSGSVATFTDPDTSASASEYSATIDWGDGSTPSTGTITGSGGSFTVNGSHTYSDEGSYKVTVTITDNDNANGAKATGTATVNDASLHAAGAAPPVSPQTFSGPVATFTDDNAATSSKADFTATIDWGDGGPASSGTVSGGGGSYTVSGSHTYGATGYYTIKVHIVDDGGSTADASSTVLVYGTAGGGSFVIGDKNSATGTSVTFWGAKWWKLNTLSGGAGPASFKGFEDQPTLPACGKSWTTDPGNSTPPPNGPLPAYMAVVVSSSISQSGSTISGDTQHVVVVQTNSGYQSDPGHPGTGKVIAQVC